MYENRSTASGRSTGPQPVAATDASDQSVAADATEAVSDTGRASAAGRNARALRTRLQISSLLSAMMVDCPPHPADLLSRPRAGLSPGTVSGHCLTSTGRAAQPFSARRIGLAGAIRTNYTTRTALQYCWRVVCAA